MQIRELVEASGLKDQELIQLTSDFSMLEVEKHHQEQRIARLEQENAHYEAQHRETSEQLRNANEAISNYQELNDELCIRIEKIEKDSKEKNEMEDSDRSTQLAESFKNLGILQKRVLELEVQDRE